MQLRLTWLVLVIFAVGIMSIGIVGCGGDTEEEAPEKTTAGTPSTTTELAEEKSEDPTVELSVPSLLQEELLGSWEVVSIFGMTPDEYLESLAEGGEVEETVKQFAYVFAADNSWTCNFVSETVFVFDDIPPGKMEAIGTWSGTYDFDGLTLSLFTKGSDVQIVSEPKDIFEIAFDLAVAEAEQHYDESFRSDFIKPFAQSTCTKQGDTLILISSAAKKMVLKKQ